MGVNDPFLKGQKETPGSGTPSNLYGPTANGPCERASDIAEFVSHGT